MDKNELKKKFIVSADVLNERIEVLITKALKHCVVTENGTVHISSGSLSAKDKIKLVLAARSLAAQLTDDIPASVSVSELAASTGLPDNQIRARAKDAIEDRFANSPIKGTYTANGHKVEAFLDSLPKEQSTKSQR